MSIILHLILGLIIGGLGVVLVIKTESILNNFGRIEFFERHLASSGGSRLGYKLFGIILIIIGFIIATGLGGAFINWVFSPITKYNN